jgi:hypothetical protein
MHALLKKLNLKTQQKLVVFNAPQNLDVLWDELGVDVRILKEDQSEAVPFCLIFCTKLNEVEKYATALDNILTPDALFWFCYPKGSSKKYKCEFNRDNGWQVLGKLGYEPVRMVAVDADWSALRFKKAELIKTMTRSQDFAMTEIGKQKTSKQ